ncbi:MAG: hypothetical protein L6V79_04150 [Clostridium sp.]|nr:MAG: hypothetical protein L6V79_04150 [Clostridium sp.]
MYHTIFSLFLSVSGASKSTASAVKKLSPFLVFTGRVTLTILTLINEKLPVA